MTFNILEICCGVLITWNLVFAQECTYDCDKCSETAYYDIVNESVCTRNDLEVRYFLLGPVYCGFGDNKLHENASCIEFGRIASGDREPRYGYLFDPFDISANWNSSQGCRIHAKARMSTTWLIHAEFSTEVCFHTHNPMGIAGSLLIGFLVGLILAGVSIRCTRNTVTDEFEPHLGFDEDFWPGCKLMAADHIVKGGGTRRFTLLFRVCQTIANAWFPMLLLIILNPVVMLSLYLLLYVIPAVGATGSAVFLQPIYLLTPPDVSLFGIDHVQPDYTISYLFHGIRPALMLGAIWLSTKIFSSHLDEESLGFWTFNESAFFRAGMMEGWGPVVLDFVVIGSIIGTTIYSFMCVGLVLQAKVQKRPTDPITLVKDNDKCGKITVLAGKICEIAKGLDHDSDSDTDPELILDKKAKLDDGLGVATLNRWSVLVALVLAVVDFCAYLYKIFVFLRSGRYFLAMIIVIALSESFFVLLLNGNLRRAPAAFRRAARDGVPTFDYLACCQWDDGLAGVPYLMTTIYGLPIAGIHTWYAAFSGIFFICTGTRAMGKFMMDVVDSDMFDVYPPSDIIDDTEYRDTLHYLAEVSESDKE